MRRAATAAAATVVAAFFGIPLAFAPGDVPASGSGSVAIPPAALAAYQRAATLCRGLRWELLAAIGQVESRHGSVGGAVLRPDGMVTPPILGPPLDGSGTGGNVTPMPAGRWAGRWGIDGPWLRAAGPMQFLPPTFDRWGSDGDVDGRVDPHDIDDAAATAARYLCGDAGEIGHERAALRRYNASEAYAADVLGWASRYAAAPPLLIETEADAAALLGHPNVTIYADGRADVVAGRVDSRVIAVLLSLATDHTITVTSLVTGHSRCAVNGQAHGPDCAVSNHYLGRGADIATIDGVAVSARHPAVEAVMDQLSALTPPYRPDEIGGPLETRGAGVFTNSFHSDHIHIGWDR
jgi:hypothetical protein